ncbi:putative cation/H+ exchanger, cation/H+ exchanger, CPA1 family [Medicago truncatula]|uniref:Putative cation/H+ exchanger, cation/H+ exchanger, CPA1 family n=1 Tax=Medicago truncatula TaxID=3880 RepID=A0A396JT79_MEDTR|nr:putative cation/H+ exchanger, cation/H+ exchanger, CPA1 family [Medicago truncatula]
MVVLPSPLHFSTSFLSSATASTIVALCVFFALLCACIIIGHLLEDSRWANESITALFLGLCSGLVVLLVTNFQSHDILVFNEDLFFLYLLPPIIFNAGFQVKKKRFFRNFNHILLFGVLGTVISFCLISLGAFLLINRIGEVNLDIQDILAIGAILSATDSVCTLQVLSQDETPLLYSIVFGEGVVNDAMSIVIFNSVQSLNFSSINAVKALELLGTFLYLFCTSTILGVAVGLLSAYLIKTFYFGRHSTDREVALMMLMAYFSYMIAELLELSGILTIFFCGIVMSHYTWHNVTGNSRTTTNIGTSIAVSSTFLALVLIGRAAFVFPIANISNYFVTRESAKIEFRSQFSHSETTSQEDSALMITSTITLVLFSTMVFGSITKPLIEAVLLKHSKQTTSDSADYHEELGLLFLESNDSIEQSNNQPFLRWMMRYPATTVHYFWRQFDDNFMRPIFGGWGFVPVVPGTPLTEEEIS